MKYSNLLLACTMAAGLLTTAGCSGGAEPGAADKKDTPITVEVAKPVQNTTSGITASGVVEAVQSAAVSTRLMGTITHIYVKVGDRVKQGQLLATISSEDMAAKKAQADAQVASARASLSNAQKDLDRYNALFSRQSATASEVDNASLRYHAARSGLDAAEQMRKEVDATAAYARLTAPYSGVITQRLMDEGSLATPGNPILTVEQAGTLRVSATIAETDISRIKTGDAAEVTIRSAGISARGTLTEISVSSLGSGGQYQVRIALPQDVQKQLYAGMYANVLIPLSPSAVAGNAGGTVAVPVTALVERDQLTGVYTVSQSGTAMLRWIRTGKRTGDQVEVLSGLGADEPFILRAAGRLYDGVPVKEKQSAQ